MIRQISITATIATGETTATATSEFINGKILKVDVNYPTNTVTVDLDTVGEQKAQKIMDLGAANTDVTYYPRVALEDNTGSALDLSDTEGGDVAMYGPFVVFGRVTLSLASGTAGEAVTVGITYEND
ncbi:hypothetical protein LCGC14_1316500 [marine sediment metagenome]|uniref:Uncharacterized protein n=1 Tax=marine sediment metagenome TaxID=412755 RepID=A0A0F9NN42_9ZZZZ